jgi:hypothetical protein
MALTDPITSFSTFDRIQMPYFCPLRPLGPLPLCTLGNGGGLAFESLWRLYCSAKCSCHTFSHFNVKAILCFLTGKSKSEGNCDRHVFFGSICRVERELSKRGALIRQLTILDIKTLRHERKGGTWRLACGKGCNPSSPASKKWTASKSKKSQAIFAGFIVEELNSKHDRACIEMGCTFSLGIICYNASRWITRSGSARPAVLDHAL